MEKQNEKPEEKLIETKKEEISEKKEEQKTEEMAKEKEIESEDAKEAIKENENKDKEENLDQRKEEIIEDNKVKGEEENKEDSEKSKENQPKENKKYVEKNEVKTKRSSKKILIILPILIVVLLFLSTIFAIINMGNEKIINGVYIEQVEIYGKSKEETNKLVEEKIDLISEISVKCGEYNEAIKIEDLGIEIDAKDALEKAKKIGKTNNIIIDNYQILFSSLFEKHFDLTININQDKFEKMVKKIEAEIPGTVKEYTYEINDEKLIITNGKKGKTIEIEQLKKEIAENIKKQFNGEEETVEIITREVEPTKIDIEKIYNEIYKEAKDAYIVEEPFELHKEEEGIDFNISLEEAKKILEEEKETYSIPLKITKPKVKVKDLGDKLFKQTLAKYTTIYDAGNANRSHNIALAAKTINGTILLPGETFSYNGILGNTNKAKGYKEGTAYVGGKVVKSYGGGICQVSSTLYNAVLYANLGIVERYNHSYVVNYVPAGRDATVAYGGKDFKFKNTRTYPIKIVANAKNGVVSISIVGIKEAKEYEIVITSSVLSSTPNKTVYEKNSNLEEGKEKVIQKGYIGKKSIAYKIVKYNGKTISKTVLSKDTYKPMNKIVQVGTKKVEQPVVTTPVTPTPSKPNQTPTQTNATL